MTPDDEPSWPQEDIDTLELILEVLQAKGRKLNQETIDRLLRDQPAQVQWRILLGLKLYGALPVPVEVPTRPDPTTIPGEERKARRLRAHSAAKAAVKELRDWRDLWYLIDFLEVLRDSKFEES